MTKKIIALIAFMASVFAFATVSASAQDTYFPYPTVPDSLQTLQKRTDYLMRHFWDYCDTKKAFSSKAKMRQAFADYVSFIPYASADSVHRSIGAFLKRLEKQPADLLFIAEEAENQLTGDSAQFISEEVFLDFVNAVVSNKKIDKTSKLRYKRLARILGGTQPGKQAPELSYVTPAGEQRHLSADTAQVVIIYFNDPDCSDCHLARVRLSADIRANELLRAGLLKVVAITPGEASDEWKQGVASYPEEWITGAAEDADDVYDISGIPTFYVLGPDNVIALKNINIDQLLTLLSRI